MVRNEALEAGAAWGCFEVPPEEGAEPLPTLLGASGRPRDQHLDLGSRGSERSPSWSLRQHAFAWHSSPGLQKPG